MNIDEDEQDAMVGEPEVKVKEKKKVAHTPKSQ